MSFEFALTRARIVSATSDDLAPSAPAFVAMNSGRIAALGPMRDFHGAARTEDCGGRLLTPGLIDCHTHLVYAGDRANEFEQRLRGASYEDIARAGAGIASTVRATRTASEEELFAQTAVRARRMIANGATTLEIKSGYGLDVDHELKQLRVARRIGRELGIEVRATCLAAHALPPEFAGRADAYVEYVCNAILPAVASAGLADAADAFCDRIGFTVAQTTAVFDAAARLGLPVKLHAEQLSDQGGARIAARYGALSCDHLEYVNEEGVVAMARAGTTAVLLPGAFYFLRETRVPPVDLLRRHRVPMAVSTDSNPGSSPTTALTLMLNLACTLFRLTPAEAFLGVTRHAAQALGLQTSHGTIEVGKFADFALWDADSTAALCYEIGAPAPVAVFKRGVRLAPAPAPCLPT